jgi:serine/threonine-protein kinase
MIATVDRLVELIHESQLFDAARLEGLRSLQATYGDPHSLAKELLRRGWLTDYQLRKIIKGRVADLSLGGYLILEPVGQGGMAEVFKVRRRRDGQIVALKVIRSDRRDDAKTLQRFRREVEAMAHLGAHPNIITACDIADVGVAHYYAMEYVDGLNLDRIIAQNGRLPVAPACDYARQAALGLQHAHEKGMVHRDLKPGNLLVAQPSSNGSESDASAGAQERFGHWGTIKVLDLGLALVPQAAAAATAGFDLTRAGFSLGTVDYMAPEQVLDAHHVDIRADLYSLGCTFYEMLTGKPPFPDGSAIDKLASHRSKEPPSLQEKRPDLPAPVVEVVNKLLAKKPALRYQTPGELSGVLSEILVGMDDKSVPLDWKPVPEGETATEKDEDEEEESERAPKPAAPVPDNQWERQHYVLIGIVAFIICLIILLMISR